MKNRINPTLLGAVLALTACQDEKPQNPTATMTNPQQTDTGDESTGPINPSMPTTTGPIDPTTGPGPGPTTEDISGTSGPSDSTFIVMTDMPPQGIECDLWSQDCPEGQKCMPWANDGGGSWNATKCSPVAAQPGVKGDPCTVEGSAVAGVDSCDVGLLCWYFDENNNGTCIDMCKGSPEDANCDDGQVCDISNGGVLTLCLEGCDPLVQSCPDNQICFAASTGNGFICDFDASGEEGQYGDTCEYINVCDYGLFCADAMLVPGCEGSIGCCTPYCDLNEPNSCPGMAMGQECVPFFTEGTAPPDHEDVGACALPI